MNKEASQPPYYSVVAPATRPLASVYLLATQRTTRARCEGLGVSDAAKLQLFHESARGNGISFLFQQAPAAMSSPQGHVESLGSMAAGVVFSLSLLLDEKVPKNQGRHQGPTAHSGRPSPMSSVASAPNPVKIRRAQFKNLFSGKPSMACDAMNECSTPLAFAC